MPRKSKSPAPTKATKRKKPAPIVVDADLELLPDAWDRFEGLVKSAAKMGHQPHDPKKTRE